MNAPRTGFVAAGLLVVFLTVYPPSGVRAQEPYQKLERVLAKNKLPDTTLIQSLPEPQTARQFWLKSRVETSPSRVKSLLKKAVVNTPDQQHWERYMKDWISVALLDDTSPQDITFLRSQLDDRVGRSSSHGTLWLKAARLARYLQHPGTARTYYKQAMADPDRAPPALLGLAELAMQEDDHDQAHEYLEEYLLEYPEEPRPEYWMLKGRLFEETGSDSEARVAYRHIVEQYPESLARDAADRRLEKLDRRRASIPDSDSSPSRQTSTNTSTSVNAPAYAIQIGSFRERQRAERLRTRVRSRLSRSVVIEPAVVQGSQYFRVILPGFSSSDDARGFLQRLKGMGFRGFLRKNYTRGQ